MSPNWPVGRSGTSRRDLFDSCRRCSFPGLPPVRIATPAPETKTPRATNSVLAQRGPSRTDCSRTLCDGLSVVPTMSKSGFLGSVSCHPRACWRGCGLVRVAFQWPRPFSTRGRPTHLEDRPDSLLGRLSTGSRSGSPLDTGLQGKPQRSRGASLFTRRPASVRRAHPWYRGSAHPEEPS